MRFRPSKNKFLQKIDKVFENTVRTTAVVYELKETSNQMFNPEIMTNGWSGSEFKYDLTQFMNSIDSNVTIVTSQGDTLATLGSVI